MQTVEVQLTNRQVKLGSSPWLAFPFGICAPAATTMAPLLLYLAGSVQLPLTHPAVLLALASIYLTDWFSWMFALPTLKSLTQAARKQ